MRILEKTLNPLETYTFTIDIPFLFWSVYIVCDSSGFIRIGPNLDSVPETSSLYLGQNGKVVYPATSRQTTVFNPSPSSVTVFAIGFSNVFDITQIPVQSATPAYMVGEGKIWFSDTIPDGWLICDGSMLSALDYPDLYDVIGNQYGGIYPNFALPPIAGNVPTGVLSSEPSFATLGQNGGNLTHTLTIAELANHTHTQNSHNHSQDSHNHSQNQHNHFQDSHNHTQNSHNHLQDSHNHTQNSHNHTQDPHSHTVFGNLLSASGTARRQPINTSGADNSVTSTNTATNQAATATNIAATATNQAATATNQDATATNQGTSATNIAATATNQAATATNQSTGSDTPFSILQPYICVHFIIYAGV